MQHALEGRKFNNHDELLPFTAAVLTAAAPQEDLVTNLPLLNFTPKFKSYSGYLRASNNDNFHYWLTESQNDPSTDPLILWLNGGPGCSSLTVDTHNEALLQFANVLFVESPSGVGFSFNTIGNLTTSDDDVAQHNYQAFGRTTFIAGESYAGVYLPTLALKMLNDSANFPSFKGMAIGNGALNLLHNYDTMVPLYYYHGLIRDEHVLEV
ncbi:serine carboxypeptidase [Ancylostoma ceylanicum]|uniref:Carboxypeptidase n=1 Tax=Ancylostoma ceylanicum TaxID=53326 RepID=A0A0D6LTP0_9BILA|nr:serine carboxypeptidase [Ancylostoma ceylanicum]